jgi:hypothetical protein
MQPTNEQVERSLAALRSESPVTDRAPRRELAHAGAPSVPGEVEHVLRSVPAVRSDRVERARERLESGDQPTAQELADRILGRFVCDRLR